MKAPLAALLMLSAAVSLAHAQTSALALPMLQPAAERAERRTAAEVPGGLVAQRAIVREWGPSDDSVYVEVRIPDWKSEPRALLASAILPGTGQLYVGEGSGWIHLAAEAAGWTLRALSVRRADDREDAFVALVGDPNEGTSGWSFDRYRTATGGDVSWLQTLWASDREAFYLALARERTYDAGFRGGAEDSAERFRGLREERESSLSRVRTLEALIVAHHLVSAWDALRAARFHNLPLRRSLPVQLGGGWRDGSPVFTAALVRRL